MYLRIVAKLRLRLRLAACGFALSFALAGSLRADSPSSLLERETWIAQLASDDWKARQRATDHLVAMGDEALPRLAQVVEESADQEVRTRAQAAIQQIEDNRLVGMTMVTMRLSSATPAAAFAELARQARAPIAVDPPDLLRKSTKPVSLAVERRPFWEVMESLSAQTGLEVTSVTRHNREVGLGVTSGGTDWMDKPIVLAGPLLIRADRLSRVSTTQLKPPRDTTEEFTVSLTVFDEPKLRVLDFSQTLRLDQAVDEKGNSLVPPADPNGVLPNADVFGNHREGHTSRWDVGATLHHPKGIGKQIKRLRASTSVLVETRAAVLDVPLANARNATRTVGGVRVTVKSVDASRAELSVFRDGRSDAEWYAVRMQLSAGRAQLLGEGDRVVARGQGSADADESADNQRLDLRLRFVREPAEDGGRGGREGKRAAANASSEPARFVWEFPVEARELVVPFEFRDLPIP